MKADDSVGCTASDWIKVETSSDHAFWLKINRIMRPFYLMRVCMKRIHHMYDLTHSRLAVLKLKTIT